MKMNHKKIMYKSYIKNEECDYYYDYDSWKDKYTEYLKFKYGESLEKIIDPYNDPDTITEEYYNSMFYKNICEFLNIREEWLEKHIKKTAEWKKWIYGTTPGDLGIFVYVHKESEPILRLHTDQFGFSAPDKKKPFHPYDVYRRIKNDNEDARKDVASWIFKTRGLGGAFIWPTNSVKNANCAINLCRGNGYIEDRVDYTLNLIKLHYETKGKDDCFGIKQESVQIWLNHFLSFEIYVQFFMFDGFFTEEKPYYSIKSIFCPHEPIDNVDTKTKRIEQCAYKKDVEALEKMLDFVANQIECRSIKMEEEIIKKRVVKR